MAVKASVIIPVRDGERYLDEVLSAVFAQEPPPLEVIVIDSGSRDRSLDIAARHPVRLERIEPSSFSHSATRNRGARMARGTHAVFLTQDATPADRTWLAHLLRPFAESPGVAGAYSRQVPRAGADLLEANDLRIGFPPAGRIKRHPGEAEAYRRALFSLIHFSDASAAYDLALLRAQPFDERLAMGEDQAWAKAAIEAGHAIVYEPRSVVRHSHDHELREKHERAHAMGVAFGTFLGPLLGRRRFPLVGWIFGVLSDTAFALGADAPWEARLGAILRAPAHRFAVHWAYARGWNGALRARAETSA